MISLRPQIEMFLFAFVPNESERFIETKRCCSPTEGVPGWFRCCMLGSRPSATKMKVLQSYYACFKCILHLS